MNKFRFRISLAQNTKAKIKTNTSYKRRAKKPSAEYGRGAHN